MKPGNSQSIRKLRQNLEEWVMSAEEDETCEILDALLSYCDDMDHNYDYETANDKRARSVAGPFIIYLAETILGPNHQSTNCH
jgi:uncharacterized protein (UPF0305 family)